MTPKPHSELLVASCTPDGGVYRYRLADDGTLTEIGKMPMPSPMFLECSGNRLYVVLRAPFDETGDSGIAVYDLDTGMRIGDVASTRGEVACHLAVMDGDVYCANYISGSVSLLGGACDVHVGHGVDPARQESPHVHSTFLSPDGHYVLSCDLGLDTIFVYDRALKPVSTARVPDGAGARHLTFSKDGRYVYCMNEMSATVSIFAYEDGQLFYLSDISVKPAGFTGQGKGSAIKLTMDGTHLYVSERGSETIALLRVDGAVLTPLAHFETHGKEPRDFTLLKDERYAVCTNQFENSIALYRVNGDRTLVYLRSYELPAPLCAVEV